MGHFRLFLREKKQSTPFLSEVCQFFSHSIKKSIGTCYLVTYLFLMKGERKKSIYPREKGGTFAKKLFFQAKRPKYERVFAVSNQQGDVMPASVYVEKLVEGFREDGRKVLSFDAERGRMTFINCDGDRVSVYARWKRGKLTVTETVIHD